MKSTITIAGRETRAATIEVTPRELRDAFYHHAFKSQGLDPRCESIDKDETGQLAIFGYERFRGDLDRVILHHNPSPAQIRMVETINQLKELFLDVD